MAAIVAAFCGDASPLSDVFIVASTAGFIVAAGRQMYPGPADQPFGWAKIGGREKSGGGESGRQQVQIVRGILVPAKASQ